MRKILKNYLKNSIFSIKSNRYRKCPNQNSTYFESFSRKQTCSETKNSILKAIQSSTPNK